MDARPRRHGRCPPASTRCASSSPTTAAASARAATSPSTSTASRSATGRVERTEPIGFGYEYTDVGRDALSPVTDDYPAGDNAFTGTIKWIEMEAGDDSHDHLIDPEDFIQLAMAKQ